jgi:hypothetical protein
MSLAPEIANTLRSIARNCVYVSVCALCYHLLNSAKRERKIHMPLFTDVIELQMKDPRNNVVEKYEYDVKKRNVQIKIKPGYDALINGVEYSGGKVAEFSKKSFGDKVVVYVYQGNRRSDQIVIPFFAGQHVVSLDTNRTAKVKFALVGEASVEIANYEMICSYFGATVTMPDIERRLNEVFKEPFSTQATAAAKQHISSSSTDVELYSVLPEIARDTARGSATKRLFDMGLALGARGISMRLNPIGDSNAVIDKINERFNNAALEQFDEAKIAKLREWEKEDRAAANQHEIDIINANNTSTRNQNNSNTYNYNGNVPQNAGEKATPKPKRHFCTNCGRELNGNEGYCPDCGTKVVR